MLYIIRGIPGSGKSTLAKKIRQETGNIHVEADMFFYQINGEFHEDGVYKFNPALLGKAHQWCFDMVSKNIHRGAIVSNTFTTAREMENYIELALENHVLVKIIQCTGEYKSIHNVPDETIAKMKKRFVDNSELKKLWDFAEYEYYA